jgi:outer membrane lipoprotein-sorting protein
MLRAVLIGMACSLAGFAAGPLDATLAKMDKAAVTFKDLTADLHKIHHIGVINEDTNDDGVIYIKRPKPNQTLMRFDIKKPDAKQVWVDSREAQIYYPKSQIVQVYEIASYKKQADALLLLGFGTTSRELQATYTIAYGGEEALNGQMATRIDLTPKSDVAHLKKVELWLSNTTGYPLQQKLYWGPDGADYDIASYSNSMINTNLPDSAVKPELPKGVKREYPQK